METKVLISEEVVIVGSRYGELSDAISTLFDQKSPIEQKDITKALGNDTVYLQPVDDNRHDGYAVAVFSDRYQRIGYVWMYQAPAMRRWLETNNRDYAKAHITYVNPVAKVLMAETDKPFDVPMVSRSCKNLDLCWAEDVPEVIRGIGDQNLSLSLSLMRDELEAATAWNDRLGLCVDNLLRNITIDLSGYHYNDYLNVYRKMRDSRIAEVRRQSDYLLYTLVYRGSKENMNWWAKEWLPTFFGMAAKGDLLQIYEADHYDLERLESLLDKAPEHLFQLFKANTNRFVNRLYYSALPQEIYNRLLTLLAVREAMLKKAQGQSRQAEGQQPAGTGPVSSDERFLNCIKEMNENGVLKNLYDYTWVMEVANKTKGLPHFNTPSSFISYLKSLGIKRLPSEDSINKKLNTFYGDFPDWVFTDCDRTEATRRINVGKFFLSLFLKS